MTKIFNLCIRDACERTVRMDVVPFIFDDKEVTDPEKAVRAAVSDFLNSGESKEAREYASGAFNWGDAMSSIPDKYFKVRGLIPVSAKTIDVEVEHDEILISGDYEEREDGN